MSSRCDLRGRPLPTVQPQSYPPVPWRPALAGLPVRWPLICPQDSPLRDRDEVQQGQREEWVRQSWSGAPTSLKPRGQLGSAEGSPGVGRGGLARGQWGPKGQLNSSSKDTAVCALRLCLVALLLQDGAGKSCWASTQDSGASSGFQSGGIHQNYPQSILQGFGNLGVGSWYLCD